VIIFKIILIFLKIVGPGRVDPTLAAELGLQRQDLLRKALMMFLLNTENCLGLVAGEHSRHKISCSLSIALIGFRHAIHHPLLFLVTKS
jgi:hypothetical protein